MHRVLLTRASGQNEELAGLLRANGIEPVIVPVLEVTLDTTELKKVVASRKFDWVVVTSPNGARSVKGLVNGATRLAAVGNHTAAVLDRVPDLIAEVTNAEGLVDVFPESSASNGAVLVCRSDLADETVADGLRSKGWDVEVVITYRVAARDPKVIQSEIESAGHLDAIVLASGSAARALPQAPAMPKVVCIGPKTEDVAREVGLKPCGTAATQDAQGLLEAVLRAVR